VTTYAEPPPADYDTPVARTPFDATEAAADAELAVTGAAVLRLDCCEAAGAVLAADGSQFADLAAGAVFAAALKVAGAGSGAVSPPTVLQQMHRDGTANLIRGDLNRIYTLTNRAAIGVANTQANAAIVAADAERRQLVRACYAGLQRAGEPGFDPTVDTDAIISAVQSVALGRTDDRPLYARDHMAVLRDRLKNPGKYQVLPWPWPDLDRIVKLRPRRFVLIAARPGGGKSLAGIKTASHAAVECSIPTAMFSMEMPGDDVMVRIAADLAHISINRLDDGDLTDAEWQKIDEMTARVEQAPLIIDDSENLTIGHIRARLRWMASEGIPAKIVIVDYVQLMHLDPSWGDAGWEKLGRLSRELKILAGEFDVAVIGMAQLNRGSEQRSDKRPQVAELRGSGNLEQDADTVILLWQEPNPDDPSMPLKAGEVKFLVDKNRRGPRSEIDLCWQPHYGRIIPFGQL
jgi:replicative DNA helicase